MVDPSRVPPLDCDRVPALGSKSGRRVRVLLALALGVAACSPTLDWREARPADGLTVLFPCKPDQHTRQLALGGSPQPMSLWSCRAGGLIFAVSVADAGEPAQVAALLQTLRTALVGNLGGAVPADARSEDVTLPGATPHPLAQRLMVRGRRADGRAIEAQVQFFCRGTQVFQATVLGDRLDPQALDMFFSSLRFAR